MSAAIAHKALVSAAMSGVRKAFKAYKKMSGRRFGQAPEYYVTTKIAEALAAEAKNYRVDLESSIWRGLKEAKSRTAGKKHRALSPTARADIAVRWIGGRPRAFFEVKHPVQRVTDGLMDDVRRMRSALSRSGDGSRLQFGCAVFYAHLPDRLKKNVDRKKWVKDFKAQLKDAVLKKVKTETGIISVEVELEGIWRDDGRGRDDREKVRWGAPGYVLLYRAKRR